MNLDPNAEPGDGPSAEPDAERLERLLAGEPPRDAAEARAADGFATWRAAAREVDASLEGRAAAASEALLAGLEGELSAARRRRFRLLRGVDRRLVIQVVAASLLVHLAALPVLAWLAFVEPEPERTIVFQLPRESPFDEPAAPPLEPLPESLDAFAGEAARATARANRVRLDQFTLTALAPVAPPAAERERVEALVAARLAHLAGRRSAPPAAAAGDGALERALRAACLLDRWALDGDARAALTADLAGALAAGPDREAPDANAPGAALLDATRGRAVAYGALELEATGPDAADPGPVDLGAWADAVLAAAAARGADTPGLRALLEPLR